MRTGGTLTGSRRDWILKAEVDVVFELFKERSEECLSKYWLS